MKESEKQKILKEVLQAQKQVSAAYIAYLKGEITAEEEQAQRAEGQAIMRKKQKELGK